MIMIDRIIKAAQEVINGASVVGCTGGLIVTRAAAVRRLDGAVMAYKSYLKVRKAMKDKGGRT